MHSALGLVRHPGNESLLNAIEMSVLAAQAGVPLHLHAEGLRGTGKTSIMRAVRRILPPIRRIPGCLYNCDPARPHCPHHRHLDPAQVAALGEEWVPMPFREISPSARVGSAVGSLDLERLVDAAHPAAALLPGTIPQAHRGILFIDEINRLAETAPELADVLLDAMGTKPGRVQIEETGLPPVELPVAVTVWAASNPDEDPGPLEEIRRQLSDRFDLVVPMGRPAEAAVVAQILAVMEATAPLPPAEPEAARLAALAARLSGVALPLGIRQVIADLHARFSLESLRAAQAMQFGVRLHACCAGRSEAELTDLAQVAPLALHHRVDGETMSRVVTHLRALVAGRPEQVAGAATPLPARTPPPAPSRDSAPPAPGARSDAAPAGTPGPPSIWRRLWHGLVGAPPSTARPAAGTTGTPGTAAPVAAVNTDPLQMPPVAPPAVARPIEALAPGELVRTEEELPV